MFCNKVCRHEKKKKTFENVIYDSIMCSYFYQKYFKKNLN